MFGGGRGGGDGSDGGGGWAGSGGGGGGADEDTQPLDLELMLIEDQPPRLEDGGGSTSIGDFGRDPGVSVVSNRVKPPDTKLVLPLAPAADEGATDSDETAVEVVAVTADQPPVVFGSTGFTAAQPPADPEEPAAELAATGAHPPLGAAGAGSGGAETAAHPDFRSCIAPGTPPADGAGADAAGLASLIPAAAASLRISFSSRLRSFSFRLSTSVLRR